MPYDAKSVANYLLALAERDGEEMSPMRLIKLAYIAHGWHSALRNELLINERPEAWKYGPVIPSLYHEFKEFGNSPISRPAMEYDPSKGLVTLELPVEDRETRSFIDSVWKVYKPYSAVQLSAMTHRLETPWYVTWHERGGKDFHGTDIDQELITEHYKKVSQRGSG